jgi:hypothetical protein
MVYALWDTESANLIQTFPTEEAALREVRLSVQELGRDAVLAWALNYRDASGRGGPIAAGEALIARALGTVSA